MPSPRPASKVARTGLRSGTSSTRFGPAGSAQSVEIAAAKSQFKKTRANSDLNNPKALFADAVTAKSAALRRICHVDPLKSLYRSDGVMGSVVASAMFTQISTILVLANTLWIAIETDHPKLGQELGHWLFSVDSAFCLLFLLELLARFAALKRWHFFFADPWLIFDTVMAIMNIVEAWMLPQFASGVYDNGASGPLRVLRVMRLTRIARTLALFRLIPELTLLIRSITQALRAVFAVICLLILFVYVNALYFTGLAKGTPLEKKHFPDVPTAMKTLIVHGTLLDEIAWFVDQIGQESVVLTILFVLFVFVTACLLLNMLVGVLVEVVTVTASVEQEEHLGQFVMEALTQALHNIGHDGRAKVSRHQFERVVRQGVMNEVLRVLNISMDKRTLLEYIFEPEGDIVETVQISNVVLTMLQLRATSPATVRDVLDTRRMILQRLAQVEKLLKDGKPNGAARKTQHHHMTAAASTASAVRGRRPSWGVPASPRVSVTSAGGEENSWTADDGKLLAKSSTGRNFTASHSATAARETASSTVHATSSHREPFGKHLYHDLAHMVSKLKDLQEQMQRDILVTASGGPKEFAQQRPVYNVFDDCDDIRSPLRSEQDGRHSSAAQAVGSSYDSSSSVAHVNLESVEVPTEVPSEPFAQFAPSGRQWGEDAQAEDTLGKRQKLGRPLGVRGRPAEVSSPYREEDGAMDRQNLAPSSSSSQRQRAASAGSQHEVQLGAVSSTQGAAVERRRGSGSAGFLYDDGSVVANSTHQRGESWPEGTAAYARVRMAGSTLV
eukprot:CAMPEP_0178452970 /NCGR_PEP_ID=MMETSP0689_2-20121128/44545_1 /TAXON_ID=160604 /ORGANISM="Amphidinium massartii, Strain CS-259" /LENGTH=784 /DNA_ID=CAMNT_0020078745 /DNA_START=70 /DNA_END=2424 /DNA_ORIENTATION=+